MLSRREKNIIKSIDLMFQGMDDDELKEIILATSLQKADLEKERIVEIINKKKEDNAKYFNEKFEIEINNKEPLKMLERVLPDLDIGRQQPGFNLVEGYHTPPREWHRL